MPKSYFYAVKEGRKPGIYRTWDECKEQVNGFSKARFKKFEKEIDALLYLGSSAPAPYTEKVEILLNLQKKEQRKQRKKERKEQEKQLAKNFVVPDGPFAFVDGSFNAKTGIYGFGGFVYDGEKLHFLCGNGNDPDLAGMRNVSGEILGAMEAVRKAEELHLASLTILYDYKGIEAWATGDWKTKKQGTKEYADFMTKGRSVRVQFQKVPAHTGIEGNETADILAKFAVGNSLTKMERDTVKTYLPEEKFEEFETVSLFG